MAQEEIKICQNCKDKFVIEPDDFAFYERIKVPPPTFCMDCRLQRRLAFRNERSLYKRKESLSGKEMLSMYSADKKLTVYPHEYWWSDKWDPLEYGADYDFSKPFFEQFKELIQRVPWPSLINWNAVNSDYCNYTTDNKNCYLVFGGDFNENCSYATFNFHSKDSQDLYWVDKMELCYECIDASNCYRVLFSQYTRDSTNSAFLYDCVNCNNCFGCVGLRNKSYCIFNEQYSKEEYEKKMEKFSLKKFSDVERLKEKFNELKLAYPHRYAEIIRSVNSTGNNIVGAKNCIRCFDAQDNIEDSRDVLLCGWILKDALGCDHIGHNAELAYDAAAIFSNTQRAFFSVLVESSHDVLYSYNVSGCSNIFGCVGTRQKEYCILNKQYSKEEYGELVAKIKKHMDEMPYTDKQDRVYKFGEFFPIKLSPFAYNETVAQEYFPLAKEEAEKQGYDWKEPEGKLYNVSLKPDELPDDISDVEDNVMDEVIGCAHEGKCDENCTTAFKIIQSELQFYRRLGLPLPRLCPSCRHYQRIKKRNPLKLWRRKCQCAGEKSENDVYANTSSNHQPHKPNEHCLNEFETTYAPDRKEIVYCEQCYQAEVV